MYTANGYIPCGGRVPAPLDCDFPPYQAKVGQNKKEWLNHCAVNIEYLFTKTLMVTDE